MRSRPPHQIVLAALVVALLATAVVARPPAGAAETPLRSSQQHPRPAGLPLPALPGPEDVDPSVAPRSQPLEPDAVLTDRFTAPGQLAVYPFDAQAGELSLFELYAAGFARGARLTSSLRVLADDGAVLVESTRPGSVQVQDLLPFVAPEAGTYRLELATGEQHFRYALVRHGDFAPVSATPIGVGEETRVHGWAAADQCVTYGVPVRAGETLALAIEGTRAEARAEHHRLLAESTRAAVMEDQRDMQDRTRRGPATRLFPELSLEVLGSPPPAATSPTFVLLAPAEADGVVELAVHVAAGGPAALFDLVVRRNTPTHTVGGLVVDGDDDPLPALEVRLLLEPDLEPWGRAVTQASGAWTMRVPAGDYRVELRHPGAESPQAATTSVRGPTELNLVWRGH